MAASNTARDDPGPERRSRIWWSVWRRRIGIGAIAGYKARWPIWAMSWRAVRCEHSQGAWPGAGARTKPEDYVEGVSASTLGGTRCSGLLHIEVWTPKGLTRYAVLFVIDLATRRVEICGVASQVNGLWMAQVARNLSDDADGFLRRKRYLIHDRDPLYTAEFLGTLGAAGIKSVKLPARSPNLNAYAERFVRTIKESCLDRMILFGEGSLRKSDS